MAGTRDTNAPHQDAGGGDDARRDTVLLDPHHTKRPTVRIGTEQPSVRASDLPPEQRPTVRVDQLPLEQRPTVRIPGKREGRRRAPLLVAAGAATTWAGFQTFGLALVFALFTGADGAAATGKLAFASFLLAHGVPVHTALGTFSLMPLALTAFAGWRLERAGLHVARAVGARHAGRWRSAAVIAAAIAVMYALWGAVAALVLRGPPHLSTSAPRAVGSLLLFGLVVGGCGALRATGVGARGWRRLPAPVRAATRFGSVAAASMVAMAAAAAALSLTLGWHEARVVFGAYDAGVSGQIGLTLLCLAYVPNGVAWASAYLLGPGFSLGAGTTVSVMELSVGAVPAVPLFAALPDGPLSRAGALVAATPVVAGIVCGLLLARRLCRPARALRPASWPQLLGSALLAGPIAACWLGLFALLSGGSLGAGRLADLGPIAWRVAAVAGGGMTVGFLLGVTAGGLLWASRPAET